MNISHSGITPGPDAVQVARMTRLLEVVMKESNTPRITSLKPSHSKLAFVVFLPFLFNLVIAPIYFSFKIIKIEESLN